MVGRWWVGLLNWLATGCSGAKKEEESVNVAGA